eukprot:scaffold10007_cov25-Prasinocladus_malaysianus.AAC.1
MCLHLNALRCWQRSLKRAAERGSGEGHPQSQALKRPGNPPKRWDNVIDAANSPRSRFAWSPLSRRSSSLESQPVPNATRAFKPWQPKARNSC